MMSIILCQYSTTKDYPIGGSTSCMGARDPELVDTCTNSIQSSVHVFQVSKNMYPLQCKGSRKAANQTKCIHFLAGSQRCSG